MKKIILIALTIALVAPNIVSAAWWNPISWFRKGDTKTEVLEKRIKELESKINGVATTTKDTVSKTTPSSVSTSTSAAKVVPKTTPKKVTPVKENLEKSMVVEIINKAKQETNSFKTAIAESPAFTAQIRAKMSEYSSNSTLQTSGQSLIDEVANRDSLMNQIISINAEIMSKASAYIYQDVSLSMDDLSPLIERYSVYYKQYSASNGKIEALIKAFVGNEGAILDQKIDSLKNQINSTQSNIQLTSDKQQRLNEVGQGVSQLNAKYAQDIKNIDIENQGRGVTEAISNAQKAQVYSEYVKNYNALLAEYQSVQYGN